MAEVLVRHSLNTNKAIKFNFTIRQVTTTKSKGDPLWVLEVGTNSKDFNGEIIPPKIISNLEYKNIDTILEEVVCAMCDVVDWGVLQDDTHPPVLVTTFPKDASINIPIKSIITMRFKDLLPSSGMDLSDMKVVFDTGEIKFDITDELVIDGDPFDYLISWRPHNLEG